MTGQNGSSRLISSLSKADENAEAAMRSLALAQSTEEEFLEPFVPAERFSFVARQTLELLQRRLPFTLWSVTRATQDSWVILDALDKGYSLAPGQSIPWPDTLCARMV